MHNPSKGLSSPARRYKSIVKYKTAFYSFYLPVAAAMYMVSEPLYPAALLMWAFQ